MTQNEINDILKQINYPGFSRDIVSFGMVEKISISDEELLMEAISCLDNANYWFDEHTELKKEGDNKHEECYESYLMWMERYRSLDIKKLSNSISTNKRLNQYSY